MSSFLGRDCAVDEPAVRSGSGEPIGAGGLRGGSEASGPSQTPDKNQEWRLEAGGTTPLREVTEQGAREQLQLAILAQSGRLTDEPDQGILVGHQIALQDGHVARGQPVYGHTLEP